MSLVFVINGLITEHSARILFEIDISNVELQIRLNNVEHSTLTLTELKPQVLIFENLEPDTQYTVQIGNLYTHQFRTLNPKLRNEILTVSCNDVNNQNDRLWRQIERLIRGRVNVILIHMGDQIYGDGLNETQRRDLYRRSYNITTPQGRVMSQCINLMLPDDHEFTNNANPFSHMNMDEFAMGLRLVEEYQKPLTPDLQYYKYVRFPHFGILFVDQRVQRLIDDIKVGYLGSHQRYFIKSVLDRHQPNVRFGAPEVEELIVITQSPLAIMGEFFVQLYGNDPVKYDFYNYGPNRADTIWLLDQLVTLRNVRVISGDIHFGAHVVYTNSNPAFKINQYVTSSISAPYETSGDNIFERAWAKFKYSNIDTSIGNRWKFCKRQILWTNTYGHLDSNGLMHIYH